MMKTWVRQSSRIHVLMKETKILFRYLFLEVYQSLQMPFGVSHDLPLVQDIWVVRNRKNDM